ncbi:hypothetical protein GcM3_220007 [Golovinomyces cichoracearum]|uniref:Restriction of telomere capping protein 4 n=1 Tax=Golovinomyces cichoracearum TaxID=62708 RepID=A0A420H766_9PEZI|nr:hypothetical protein GcM3_220007 [Golovinomyces cichoracearum]
MPTTASRKIERGCSTIPKPKPSSENSEEVTQPTTYSSCSDGENHADIRPVMLKRNSRRSDNSPQRDRTTERRTSSQNSSGYGGVNSYRSRRGIGTSKSQNIDSNSIKNNVEVKPSKQSSKIFEDILRKENIGKKKKRAVYGKSSQPSSQNTESSQPRSSQTSQTSPGQKLKSINLPLSDSEKSDEESSAFKPPSSEFLDYIFSESPDTKSLSMAHGISAYSSSASSPVAKRKLINSSTTDIFKNELPIPKLKLPKVLDDTPESYSSDPPGSFGTSFQKSENEIGEDRTKLLFKAYNDLDFDDDVPTSSDMTARSFDTENIDEFPSASSPARCPMCNEPVSPTELRSRGNMNTRRQEQFCLAHRKKSAMKEWELNRYPQINWNNLDDRISKHHLFLKNLINGEDSYYRKLLQDKIDQGKDRNLRTTTSNLIPGYYGPRGLRIMSENVFDKFTPLLKKRIIQDRLIAARGYTPYVQSVLVPEVATLLIQEDMVISLSEARNVMLKSAAVGELLHDEVRDDFQIPSPCKISDYQSSPE